MKQVLGNVLGFCLYRRDYYKEMTFNTYGEIGSGKILSRVLERNEISIDHAILDAAPLLPLPKWSVDPLRYYQSANVWTCYHWTGFWKWVPGRGCPEIFT